MEAQLIQNVTSSFLEQGILGGLVLIVLAIWYKQNADHRKDNDKWLESTEKRHAESLEVIKDNTTQISHLATLIESKLK